MTTPEAREWMMREFAEVTMKRLSALARTLKGDDERIALDSVLAIQGLMSGIFQAPAANPSPKDNAAGWKIITDDAKTAGRILLLWVPTGGLGEHVELGYWSAILDKWVNTYGKAFSAAPDRWATLAPFIDSAPPQDNADDYRCPICAEPLKASDICASDITEGTCHAECLAGSPVVDLDTGDEIPGCKIDTYPYREVMEPPAAYRCDTCGAHIVAGACDCTKMQRPVLIGNDKPAPKDKKLPLELDGVAEQLAEQSGFWRSCSGCHETNEGVPLGPYSTIMQCHLGMGCRECGGIGAIWDSTDYEDFGRFIASEASNADA